MLFMIVKLTYIYQSLNFYINIKPTYIWIILSLTHVHVVPLYALHTAFEYNRLPYSIHGSSHTLRHFWLAERFRDNFQHRPITARSSRLPHLWKTYQDHRPYNLKSVFDFPASAVRSSVAHRSWHAFAWFCTRPILSRAKNKDNLRVNVSWRCATLGLGHRRLFALVGLINIIIVVLFKCKVHAMQLCASWRRAVVNAHNRRTLIAHISVIPNVEMLRLKLSHIVSVCSA